MAMNHAPVALGWRAGGRELDSGRTNTRGLLNNWEESAAFVIDLIHDGRHVGFAIIV